MQTITRASRSRASLTLAACLAAAGLAVGTGCKGQQKEAQVEPPPAPVRQAVQPARIAVSGPIDRPSGRGVGGTKLVNQQRLDAPPRAPESMSPGMLDAAPGQVRRVKYAARAVEAEDFLRVVVGDLLDRPYLVEPGVKGGVTIDIDQEMTDAELYDLVGAVSSLMGWTLQERDDLLIVSAGQGLTRAPGAPILNGRSADPTDFSAIRIYRLSHISAGQAAEACKEFISDTARTVVAGRLLAIADRVSQLNRIGTLLSALDAPAFDGVEMWTYRLAHQKPEDASRVLTSIAGASGLSSGNDARIAFLPLGATDRMMVVSRDPGVQPLVRRWVEQFDAPSGESVRQRYFYRIQHFAPTELLRLLKEFMVGDIEDGPANPADNRMRLAVSQEEDLLLIYSTPGDYADLLALLERIDRPRQQVFVQSVIAEVSLSDNLAYGVEYFLEATLDNVGVELLGTAPLVGQAGGSAFFVGTDGFAVIEALDRTTDVALISAPSLFVQDKGEAKIQVGGETPILTSARETDQVDSGDSTVRNEIEYRDTGVTLTVQPRVNEGGSVTLQITQEIRDAIENSSSTIGSPEFTTRVIETTVTVPHGQTLLLGGIITEDRTKSVDRIPVLGRMPLIGPAFRSVSNETLKRELLLAITPTIVSDPHDVPIITGDFLNAVEGVRDALEKAEMGFNVRTPGSLDPSGAGSGAGETDAEPVRSAPEEKRGADAFGALAMAAGGLSDPHAAPVQQFLMDLAALLSEREGAR
jgi:general secretion pathway protein D